MNRHDLAPARLSQVACSRLSDSIDAVARCLIEHAARRVPTTLAERLREEWLADLSEDRGPIARLRLALGCFRAAFVIRGDVGVTGARTAPSAVAARIMVADIAHISPFPRLTAAASAGPVICEINTTSLIDVLLVLLVTLIITLPMMTQSVRLDLPHPPSRAEAPPEVINLDIDFDGTVVWNGSRVANLAQLESYFRAESRRSPQPEIHLRPDAYAKYDVVAKVLAAAQRNRLEKLGFVNNAEFSH